MSAAAVDGRAPRLGPRQYLGRGFTRAGRFRDVDPLTTPARWNAGRWLGLLLWGLAVGGSLARAWRGAGGVDADGTGTDGDGQAAPGAS